MAIPLIRYERSACASGISMEAEDEEWRKVPDNIRAWSEKQLAKLGHDSVDAMAVTTLTASLPVLTPADRLLLVGLQPQSRSRPPCGAQFTNPSNLDWRSRRRRYGAQQRATRTDKRRIRRKEERAKKAAEESRKAAVRDEKAAGESRAATARDGRAAEVSAAAAARDKKAAGACDAAESR